MKNKAATFLRFMFFFCFISIQVFGQHKFLVNFEDDSVHQFNVTVFPKDLTPSNKIFQFASTAPGTYQTMDIGIHVKSFKAFDKSGNEIGTSHVSTNQWSVSSPEKIDKIIYSVEDTWHSSIDSDRTYLMSGSNIEKDNVLVNGQCVFGYFEGMQSYPIKVKIDYPKDWQAGTALPLDNEGYYDADTYDKIVDSPILLGKLTTASTQIGGTKIEVYTYSKTNMIKSEDMLNMLKNILHAENDFIGGLPVKNYAFLFHFENSSAGAWEHSYSSEYVFQEVPLNEQFKEILEATVAHEFFHIVTPLNIHSELIEKFNFVKPVMSQHLWFYEGVTEWAAHIMELRDSLINLEQYLDVLRTELIRNDSYKQDVSLTELGIHSTEMQDQYTNIYMKGAFTAALLDIRLIELSHGKKGLREVIQELLKTYGPKKPFSEKNFFDDFTKMTYPEIADFFDKYVKNSEKLPVSEYFSKVGIIYKESAGFDSSKVSLGLDIGVKDNKLIITNINDPSITGDLFKPGDVLEKYENEMVTFANVQSIFSKLRSFKAGDKVNFTIIRDGKELGITAKLGYLKLRHNFKIDMNADEKQIELRKAWVKNL